MTKDHIKSKIQSSVFKSFKSFPDLYGPDSIEGVESLYKHVFNSRTDEELQRDVLEDITLSDYESWVKEAFYNFHKKHPKKVGHIVLERFEITEQIDVSIDTPFTPELENVLKEIEGVDSVIDKLGRRYLMTVTVGKAFIFDEVMENIATTLSNYSPK